MNPLREITYRARRLLINVYGPPQLDEKHDPVVQLDQEHEDELREEALDEERASTDEDRADTGSS